MGTIAATRCLLPPPPPPLGARSAIRMHIECPSGPRGGAGAGGNTPPTALKIQFELRARPILACRPPPRAASIIDRKSRSKINQSALSAFYAKWETDAFREVGKIAANLREIQTAWWNKQGNLPCLFLDVLVIIKSSRDGERILIPGARFALRIFMQVLYSRAQLRDSPTIILVISRMENTVANKY